MISTFTRKFQKCEKKCGKTQKNAKFRNLMKICILPDVAFLKQLSQVLVSCQGIQIRTQNQEKAHKNLEIVQQVWNFPKSTRFAHGFQTAFACKN